MKHKWLAWISLFVAVGVGWTIGCLPQGTAEMDSMNGDSPTSHLPTYSPGITKPIPTAPPLIEGESPKPSESEIDIAIEIRILHCDMLDLSTKYPTSKPYQELLRPVVPKTPVHDVTFGTRDRIMYAYIPAEYFSEACIHIDNAFYLSEKGRLPTEMVSRAVTMDEIASELNMALLPFKKQISDCPEYRLRCIEYATELVYLENYRESVIEEIIEFYEEYIADLTEIVEEIEAILYYSPH